MQRWIKLHDGRFIDADRILFISKVETFNRLDEVGNDLGTGYSVNIGTGFEREDQLNVIGTKEEIHTLLKGLLSGSAPARDQE